MSFELPINQIIQGDCLEVMRGWPDKCVDLIVTDPPYGIDWPADNGRFCGGTAESKKHRGAGTRSYPKIVGDDKPFDPRPLLRFGRAVIFGWNHFADKLPPGTTLVWLKRNDDAFGTFLSDAEIAWYSEGHGVYCKRDLSNNGITDERAHPTQKPLPLIRWIIDKYSEPDDLILDPFAGSGTTLVAAKQLGRRYIGIEIEPKYVAICKERLKQEQLDLR